MKFICLKYLDRNIWKMTSERDRSAFLRECGDYDRKLRESGHCFATESALTQGPSVGLRCSNGQLLVEDDRSIPADEWLGGLMFLEARDLNHAIVLVSDHPGVRVGWFEIYPADDREDLR